MTALFRDSAGGKRIEARLQNIPPDDYGTTILSFKEQARGWMDALNRRKKQGDLVASYRELDKLRHQYQRIAVWQYNEQAESVFRLLVKANIKIGTQDLRIAAIALVNAASLPTCNSRDFSKVPDLRIEDWTTA